MVWPTDHDVKLTDSNICTLPGQQIPATQASTPMQHILNINVKEAPQPIRITNICATMGPSLNDIYTVERMLAAGTSMIRIKLAYNTKIEIMDIMKLLKQAVKNYSVKVGRLFPLAIAFELTGKTIFSGEISESYGGYVELKEGEIIRLTTDESYKEKSSNYTLFVDFENISDCVSKGDEILIDKERIQLRVEVVSTSTITCRIERGGHLGSRKEIFIPRVKVTLPVIGEQDKADIEFSISQQVDYIILPFTTKADHVKELRNLLGEKGKKIGIIAKLQTHDAYDNLDEILECVNGVIISREEFGTDVTLKKLPLYQKVMIKRITNANVACILSSQILRSMVVEKNPKRSDVLDIANMVMDGVDAIMLDSETAHGNYPVDSVVFVGSICIEAEAADWSKMMFKDLIQVAKLPCDAVLATAMSAVLASLRAMAAAIVVVTTSGRSAKLISLFRPRCPIIAITRYPQVARSLQLWRGIVPLVYEDSPDLVWLVDVERRVNVCIQFALERNFVRFGDPIVLVTGWRQGSGFTNTMRMVYATEDFVKMIQ